VPSSAIWYAQPFGRYERLDAGKTIRATGKNLNENVL
jgi:hypothetical protein